MNINDIFTLEQYDEAYEFVKSHEYTHIEDLGNGQYQLVQDHIPTEEELAKEEKIRIANLNLTGADVERGIYEAKGMDFDDILAFVMANPPKGLDVKRLRIELKANHFYRGNPYVEAIGKILGFTDEQLNLFFEDGDSSHLLPQVEPEVIEDIPPINEGLK